MDLSRHVGAWWVSRTGQHRAFTPLSSFGIDALDTDASPSPSVAENSRLLVKRYLAEIFLGVCGRRGGGSKEGLGVCGFARDTVD